jgi:hypothetical protein
MAGRIRTIKPELREHLAFASLSDRAARLFTMLYTLVDDEGRCPGGAGYLLGQVFFAKPVSPQLIGRAIAELEEAKLIRTYVSNNAPYLEILGWREKGSIAHQVVNKPQPGRYPAPSSPDYGNGSGNDSRSAPVRTSDLRTSDLDQDHDPDQDLARAPVHAIPGGGVSVVGKLAMDAWSYASKRHLAVRSELDPTAVPWSAIPTGEGKNELLARVRELVGDHDQPDLEAARATLRRAVDVAEAEARAASPPTLRWFIPSRLWSSQSFWRCAEQSPEQVTARPHVRTNSGSSGVATPSASARAVLSITEEEQITAIRVLGKFDERLDTNYVDSDVHRELVVRRLREGRAEMDLRKVLAYLAEPHDVGGQGWLESAKMRGHLNPDTVLKPETLDKYLELARAWFEKHHDSNERKPAKRAPATPAFGLQLVHSIARSSTDGGSNG